MITGIVPIWVKHYAKNIIKLDRANVLDSYNKKYHIYDHEFGKNISDEKQRKSSWDLLHNYNWICFCSKPLHGYL